MPSSDERSVTWLTLQLSAPAELAPELGLALERRGFEGWVVDCEDPLGWTVYLPQVDGWEQHLGSLSEELQAMGAWLRESGCIRDEDWAENWKRFYHPIKVGPRLVVRPSWEVYESLPEERVIVLDPGSAFGTGYHWSTRLCLELLESVSEKAPLGRVLDFGTGSGILAIGAGLLGASEVLACDRDPVAVQVARTNLAENGVGAIVLQVDRPPPGPFQLILANLTAEIHLRLVEALARELAPHGRLIAGGIIEERRDEVARRFEAEGLELEQARVEDGWVGMGWKRRS
ncbi:MAG: 50S ribosomal protein L11 methyltransferase [Armatimonadetes bacterium]|nr:50S ribosomal protein L11 methyltransferase [Armatimonadota bacterium]